MESILHTHKQLMEANEKQHEELVKLQNRIREYERMEIAARQMYNALKEIAQYKDVNFDEGWEKWGKESNRWISVEDRMPPRGVDVFCVDVNEKEYECVTYWCYNGQNGPDVNGMTHWMWIPERPTKEQLISISEDLKFRKDMSVKWDAIRNKTAIQRLWDEVREEEKKNQPQERPCDDDWHDEHGPQCKERFHPTRCPTCGMNCDFCDGTAHNPKNDI